MMTKSAFWKLIGKSTADAEATISKLEQRLRKLSAEDLVAFQDQLETHTDLAFTWDLWGAAYLIEGGCSDDGFLDFRRGLIVQGQEIYQRAVRNPDSLAKLDPKWISNEEIGLLAGRLYERKFGSQMPERQGKPKKRTPFGERWTFENRKGLNADQYARRLPSLWAKHVAAESSRRESDEISPGRLWQASHESIIGGVCKDLIGYAHFGGSNPEILWLKLHDGYWYHFCICCVGRHRSGGFRFLLQSIRSVDENELKDENTVKFKIAKDHGLVGRKITQVSFDDGSGQSGGRFGELAVRFDNSVTLTLQTSRDASQLTVVADQ